MDKLAGTRIFVVSADIQSQYSVSMPSFGAHDPELDQTPEELFRQGNNDR